MVAILPRDRIKKTEKEGKHWERRRKDNETEFALYDYGFAYLTGLSNRICAWQTPPVFKIKRKHPPGEFISDCSSHTGQITKPEIISIMKIMDMPKKGNDAYSKDPFSRPTNDLRFPY
jgi:hypothetical protein